MRPGVKNPPGKDTGKLPVFITCDATKTLRRGVEDPFNDIDVPAKNPVQDALMGTLDVMYPSTARVASVLNFTTLLPAVTVGAPEAAPVVTTLAVAVRPSALDTMTAMVYTPFTVMTLASTVSVLFVAVVKVGLENVHVLRVEASVHVQEYDRRFDALPSG